MSLKYYALAGVPVGLIIVFLSSLHPRFNESFVTGGSWSQLIAIAGLLISSASLGTLFVIAVEALWRLM